MGNSDSNYSNSGSNVDGLCCRDSDISKNKILEDPEKALALSRAALLRGDTYAARLLLLAIKNSVQSETSLLLEYRQLHAICDLRNALDSALEDCRLLFPRRKKARSEMDDLSPEQCQAEKRVMNILRWRSPIGPAVASEKQLELIKNIRLSACEPNLFTDYRTKGKERMERALQNRNGKSVSSLPHLEGLLRKKRRKEKNKDAVHKNWIKKSSNWRRRVQHPSFHYIEKSHVEASKMELFKEPERKIVVGW
eukprot:g3429.t1